MQKLIHGIQNRFPLTILESELEDNTARFFFKKHKARTVEKIELNGRWYFYKHRRMDTKPELLELEACYSEIYRLLLDKRAPRCIVVTDQTGNPCGLLSEAIDGYIPANDVTDINTHLLLRGHVADVLVAAYWMREDDFHKSNFGLNRDNKFCKVDNDSSLWPLTVHFKGDRINQAFPIDQLLQEVGLFSTKGSSSKSSDDPSQAPVSYLMVPHEKRKYRYTQNDIDNFPDIQDAKHYYWPTQSSVQPSLTNVIQLLSENTKAYCDLKISEEFRLRMNFMFLFILSIDWSFFQYAVRRHIRSEQLQKTVYVELISMQMDIEKIMLETSQFRCLLSPPNPRDKLEAALRRRFQLYEVESKTDGTPETSFSFDLDKMNLRLDTLIASASSQIRP